MITEIIIKRLICNLCGHIWYSAPTKPAPKKCPACFDNGHEGWSWSGEDLKKTKEEAKLLAERWNEQKKEIEEMWRLETGADDYKDIDYPKEGEQ